ncbi:hypothetical protein NJBCHELONAE_43430 [Mycobacteroides chelonae]|uniref:hypothetical protein n=1 Tax=Mycobacteroides chelonae TaxID=1774 RepID=UPI0021DCF8FA|nr:hypothetical protein [Mycobacteroides chelonae]GLE59032.1 hypothetical protein NJBCHELONAE_43430 [Mycobacteroides chelonae]
MSELSADDRELILSGRPFGLFLDTDDVIRGVEVHAGVVAQLLGTERAESATTTKGLVFWFDPDSADDINQMATLHLFAIAGLSVREVPLLHGPVLITGWADGVPTGLTREQRKAFKYRHPGPWWRYEVVLQWRTRQDQRRRRRAARRRN